MLVDKKLLFGGIAMVAVGGSIFLYLNSIMPIGTTGMSDEETLDLLLKQRENEDMKNLTGILIGIGFLLILLSFGAIKKRKGGAKKVEKKPTTD